MKELSPERQLDFLIGLHVMQHKITLENALLGPECDSCDLPEYSTNFYWTMEVIEGMKRLGFWFVMGNGRIGQFGENDVFWASFGKMHDIVEWTTGGKGDTEEEQLAATVCLAALKAVGYKLND